MTIIQDLGKYKDNHLYLKREDLIPYSFGGNKARKARLFFQEIDRGEYDNAVTYGSSHSNHCRVVANMAAARGMPCYIIAPQEVSEKTFNSKLMKLFGANITTIPVNQVHDTIETMLAELRSRGKNPYFIPGGGHGNIGTQAYVDCYEEICSFERSQGIHFDYIFFASGTGTTQAGLICGQLIHSDDRKIVGISIARKNPYGRNVVLDSVRDYLKAKNICRTEKEIQERTIFIDDYIGSGYGKSDFEIQETIKNVMIRYSIPLDSTYTGKAFYGMQQYLRTNDICEKNVFFIHTGGTPLFFDDLETLFE